MTSRYNSCAGCTLSPREPETMRERECRWKHSPRLGCSRVASGARVSRHWLSFFLVVCDVQVLAWLSPRVTHVKIKSSRQECRELYSHGLVSCNSLSRVSPNRLGESVQPALYRVCYSCLVLPSVTTAESCQQTPITAISYQQYLYFVDKSYTFVSSW